MILWSYVWCHFSLASISWKRKFLLYISDKGNPLFDHGNYTQNLFPLYQHTVRHQSDQNKIPSKMDEKQTCLVSKFTSTFLCQDKDGQPGTLELCIWTLTFLTPASPIDNKTGAARHFILPDPTLTWWLKQTSAYPCRYKSVNNALRGKLTVLLNKETSITQYKHCSLQQVFFNREQHLLLW